jgi:ABC-type transport system involved in cytochrome c biogenesis permease subunit
MPIERITIFAASYAVALALEVIQLFRPSSWLRFTATSFGVAGLLAHTLFLAAQRPLLASQFGSLLFLGWILAVFYLYGSLHHLHMAWSVFVLPVVLSVVILAGLAGKSAATVAGSNILLSFDAEGFWRVFHVAVFILAAVGVCVAFVASAMYLVQAHRLRAKAIPGRGLRLLSLERLEAMNRRAINLAFPLLTVGVLVGGARLLDQGSRLQGWSDPRILSTTILWLVFAIVLYLRYGLHLGGRRTAVLTLFAFGLLLISLVTSHSVSPGGGP